jgi:tRNA pseudouridine55 synthase
MPPAYSAKLIEVKRSYEFARKGQIRELLPVNVFFREIEMLSFNMPDVKVRLLCSKGTYIRSFARDLGQALGSGAYLSELERTAIGKFNVSGAFTLESFREYLEKITEERGKGGKEP